MAAAGPTSITPALLISTSTGPSRARTDWISCCTAGLVPDVARERDDLGPSSLEEGARALQGAGVPAADGDPRPHIRGSLGEGEPQAPRAAGDEHGPAGQVVRGPTPTTHAPCNGRAQPR